MENSPETGAGNRATLHLLIDEELWNDLRVIDYFGHPPVITKAMAILHLFYHNNRSFIKLIGNERSKKFRVPDAHDIHLKMPLYIYRWLKKTHAGQNVHGMAQIVRAILRYYVELVKKYGTERARGIFTGTYTYRVKRAFVRFRRVLLYLGCPRREMLTQLDHFSCLAYKFIKGFVVIMQ